MKKSWSSVVARFIGRFFTIGLTMILLVGTSGSYAANKNVGTTGAQFLKIGSGARPVGMGRAFAGVADDVNSLYWNPAGIGQLAKPEFTAMHLEYFQDINYEYLGYAQPLGGFGNLGFSAIYLNMSDLEKRAADTIVGNTDTWDGSKFKASDSAGILTYAKGFGESFFAGLNLKYINSKIETESGTAFAGDIGGLYKLSSSLTTGLVVQNIGSKLKFIEEGDNLPLNVKLGFGYKALKDALTLGLDLNYPTDNDFNAAAGGEYLWRFGEDLGLAIRTGYQSGTDLGSLSGLSAGAGFSWRGYGLDFAWVPYGDLGTTYRFSIMAKF